MSITMERNVAEEGSVFSSTGPPSSMLNSSLRENTMFRPISTGLSCNPGFDCFKAQITLEKDPRPTPHRFMPNHIYRPEASRATIHMVSTLLAKPTVTKPTDPFSCSMSAFSRPAVAKCRNTVVNLVPTAVKEVQLGESASFIDTNPECDTSSSASICLSKSTLEHTMFSSSSSPVVILLPSRQKASKPLSLGGSLAYSSRHLGNKEVTTETDRDLEATRKRKAAFISSATTGMCSQAKGPSEKSCQKPTQPQPQRPQPQLQSQTASRKPISSSSPASVTVSYIDSLSWLDWLAMEVPPPPTVVLRTSELNFLPMFDQGSGATRSLITPALILSIIGDKIPDASKPKIIPTTKKAVKAVKAVKEMKEVKEVKSTKELVVKAVNAEIPMDDSEGHTTDDVSSAGEISPVRLSHSNSEDNSWGTRPHHIYPKTPEVSPNRPTKSKSSNRRRPVHADEVSVRETAEKRKEYHMYHEYYQSQMREQEEQTIKGDEMVVDGESGESSLGEVEKMETDEDFDGFLFTLIDDFPEFEE